MADGEVKRQAADALLLYSLCLESIVKELTVDTCIAQMSQLDEILDQHAETKEHITSFASDHVYALKKRPEWKGFAVGHGLWSTTIACRALDALASSK